ncbi:hypothetical protein [Burkholderia pyrrocinia]|uniref:hypothetical protein n=1 Tax=Burkholderia pyrrocinia TaxID=60550 RepID=UPI0035C6C0B8
MQTATCATQRRSDLVAGAGTRQAGRGMIGRKCVAGRWPVRIAMTVAMTMHRTRRTRACDRRRRLRRSAPVRGNDRQRHACVNFAICCFVTWLPSYLLQSRGFSLASLGTWRMLPALLAIPGGRARRICPGQLVPVRQRRLCRAARAFLFGPCIGQ